MKPIKIEFSDKEKVREGLKFSSSPYNFVSLPAKAVYRYYGIEDLPSHSGFTSPDGKDLLSGVVEYELEAKNPIIVSAGVDDKKDAHFFKGADGKYAIPGNTVRGMIRSNLQILSYSDSSEDIEDGNFLYRDVAGNGSLSDRYKKILNININKRIAQNIKAGYIVKKRDGYEIIPAKELKKGTPYFRVDELRLRKIVDKNFDKINYLYRSSLSREESRLSELNKTVATSKDKGAVREARKSVTRTLLKHSNESQYRPYQAEISFEYDSDGKIVKVGEPSAYGNKGWILSGGFIAGKRSHYIVPEPDLEKSRREIERKYSEAYKDDCIATKKAEACPGGDTLKSKDRKYDFFLLPEKIGDEHKKPIFYYDLDVLHFGFTPYIRMFYTKSIKDGIKLKKKEGLSYSEALFGFINRGSEKDSYKSRVSFEDAKSENGEVDRECIMDMILAGPKPTSYNLYLKQDRESSKKEIKVYEDDFEIRGVKQYWLKKYIEDPVSEKTNENMKFKIHPLKAGSKFKGKVHFENLCQDELGLLLWSLKLEEGSYQSIGQAKPYGFGRVEVNEVKLKIEDLSQKYESFSFDYMEEKSVEEYIEIYKSEFSKRYLDGKQIDAEKSIRELMKIKSKLVESSDQRHYRYMNLKDFTDKKVLPEILCYESDIGKTGSNKPGNFKGFKKNDSVKGSSNKRGQRRSDDFGESPFALALKKAEEEKKRKK